MKLGIMYANAGPFALPEHLETLARSAEETGFESLFAVEHVAVPAGYESRYPYSDTGRMPAPENVPIPDPIVSLAYAAAVSRTLRLGTGIVILPQRHPIYVAKEIASLDVYSRGRALFGVGIGWLAEEFAALGVPFDERAARTEESIQAIRALWRPGPQSFEGRFFRFAPVESNPKPVQEPGVPILVGGHVPAAARRAARLGDGFFPARQTPESLAKLLSVLRDECGKTGRDPGGIELTAGVDQLDLDTARRFQELRVHRVVIPPPAFDPDGLRRGLQEVGDTILAKL